MDRASQHDSDRDSHNNIGSELLINPKRKASGTLSGASSVVSAERKRPMLSEEKPEIKTLSVSSTQNNSPTVGNIMGSRRSHLPSRKGEDIDGDDGRSFGSESAGGSKGDDEESEALPLNRYDQNLSARDRYRSSVSSRYNRSRREDHTPSERSLHRSKRSYNVPETETDTERSVATKRSHHYQQRRHAPRVLSDEEIRVAKQELLHQFDRLEDKGYRVSHKFSIDSSLEEMKAEFERVKKDRGLDNSIKFQRNILMMCVNSVEYLNNRFDPFDIELDGWAMSVSDGLVDYDEIFERLYEKYGSTSRMEPEMQLMFSLGGSAMMFHLENKLLGASSRKNNGSNGASATQQPRPQRAAGGGGGLFGAIGNMFGMGGGSGSGNGNGRRGDTSPPPNPPPYQQPRQSTGGGGSGDDQQFTMRGPTMNDDILRDIQQNAFRSDNNERIEMVSNGGDSDIEDLKDGTGVSVFADTNNDGDAGQSNHDAIPPPNSKRGGGGRRGGGGARGGRGSRGGSGGGKTLVL